MTSQLDAAGNFTGGALNPARLLGPAIVFDAKWHQVLSSGVVIPSSILHSCALTTTSLLLGTI